MMKWGKKKGVLTLFRFFLKCFFVSLFFKKFVTFIVECWITTAWFVVLCLCAKRRPRFFARPGCLKKNILLLDFGSYLSPFDIDVMFLCCFIANILLFFIVVSFLCFLNIIFGVLLTNPQVGLKEASFRFCGEYFKRKNVVRLFCVVIFLKKI